MPLPVATVGSLTASGDTVLPPGNFQVLIGGLPAACVGDMVAGPFFNSGPAFIISGNLTVLVGGRPLARVTSMVAGLTATLLGPVPVSSPIITGAMNVLA
jgi:uncharacterized Zn-binding protein involved in type VI secretion